MDLGEKIVLWYEQQGRRLPWRETQNPYFIWISEVILQQTRIEQGTGYYHRFIGRFPDVQTLAEAEIDEVLKYWEGLGYYSRARNLHAAAKQIMHTYGGYFPEHHTELIKLKGIGPYSARAIGSFAFGNVVAVLDGNVFRVVSRLLNDDSPIDMPATRKAFQAVLDDWIKDVNPSHFNQGMMDLGAMVCTPTSPKCPSCPLQAHCLAYQAQTVASLPRKQNKLKRTTRHHLFYWVRNAQNQTAIRRRPSEGLWGGLYELPNVEVSEQEWQEAKNKGGTLAFKHVFTHFDMEICVLESADAAQFPDCQWVDLADRKKYAFSRAVLKIFEHFAEKSV